MSRAARLPLIAVAVVVVVAAAVLVALAASGRRSLATVDRLDVVDFAFDPTPATITAGSSLRIVNADGAKHTVTSGSRDDAGEIFDVALDPHGTGALVVDEPGTYPYTCRIHPGMTGTLEVVD